MSEPPQDIKTTIEKTAQYVKKNGTAFERKLLQNDSDGKFSFLNNSDKYNSYYKSLLEGRSVSKNGEAVNQNDQKEIFHEPLQFLFVTELPPISTYDLNVIKLTAQYSAINSSKHTEALHRYMDKKGNRSQFAFLNRGHSLHSVFQSYLRQYLAIIDASKGKKNSEAVKHIDELISSTPQKMFQNAYERAVYEKKHKMDRRAKESELRDSQLQYALIDWQDFTFVAKVNFDAVDEVSELAVPLLRADVVYRALLAKSKEIQLEVLPVKESEVNEESPETLEQNEVKMPEVQKLSAVPKGMKIRAAGESRLKRKNREGDEKRIQCPITGQMVAELKFDQHLRVLLRDPRYKEQQDNYVKKNFSYASNITTDQVYENIKRLVKKRGYSEEEEENSKRIDIGPQQ
ncbi:CIC11C00000001929 [Sungouiella intermedia]|uniref:CIC11C00000001929 n=1 Tax=Sungouiella intermedia TaxID=45354 RepID=A0A1L0G5Z1_9ASCO|nr:CIC11C00000001929 [[Candida] intermedia]